VPKIPRLSAAEIEETAGPASKKVGKPLSENGHKRPEESGRGSLRGAPRVRVGKGSVW